MTRLRPLVGAIAISFAGLFGASCNLAYAQLDDAPSIPKEVLTSSSTLTTAQRQDLEIFADYWLGVLNNGTQQERDVARKRLAAATTAGAAGTDFRTQYNHTLLTKIAQQLQSQNVPKDADTEVQIKRKTQQILFRINTMRVINRASGKNILPVLQVGLNDPNAGVRYTTAVAAAEMASRKAFIPEEQIGILKQLEKALGKETQSAALAVQLKALNAMKIEQARAVLMNVLSERINVHNKDATISYDPELAALSDMYRKVIDDYANSRDGVFKQINDLASISFRYMKLVTIQLEEQEDFTPEQIASRKSMVERCDSVLRFAATSLAEGEMLPKEIASALTRLEWDFILIQIDQWERILKKGPFNMASKQLSVTATKQN